MSSSNSNTFAPSIIHMVEKLSSQVQEARVQFAFTQVIAIQKRRQLVERSEYIRHK